MEQLGYNTQASTIFSTRKEEFRQRHLRFSKIDTNNQVIELLLNFHGYNILQYQNNLIGIPISLGDIDLTESDFRMRNDVVFGKSLIEVQHNILHKLLTR